MGSKPDGKYGAQGMTGGEAISRQLDQLVKESGAKSFRAKVEFLTGSAAGQQAMVDAGIDLNKKSTQKTVLGWLEEPDPETSPKYRRAVDRAYEARKRHTMAASLKRRLAKGGRGTQVEVTPLNQRKVSDGRKRDLPMVKVNIHPVQWDRIVDAWEAGDIHGLDAIWDDIAEDSIGSEWAAYGWVSSIRFGA